MDRVFSFPHMGNYHLPISHLLRLVLGNEAKILSAPPITQQTLDIGSKHSPDFVCVPFKYNLGNYIQSLEMGANVLIQAGGGCRYGFYGEVQEQILQDLGYEFEFVQFLGNDLNVFSFYKKCRQLGSKLSFIKFCYYLLLMIKVIKCMDAFESRIRENIGFEVEKHSFEALHGQFLNALCQIDSFEQLSALERDYDNRLRVLKVTRPENCLRVGLIGELYTLMEPFSNFFMEKELAKSSMAVSRFITVTYLLFEKEKMLKKVVSNAWPYLKYHIGADGSDSVSKARALAESNYDGLIHVKPFGCTPEVNAMPMLQNISKDLKIPILYFSFDSQTSETGIRTRLEAFSDMILMRRERIK